MALLWNDIIDLLETRARRLGMPDDATELLLTAYSCLERLVEMYDIVSYTATNTTIAKTITGIRQYPLPDDFGRPLHVDKQFQQTGGVPGTGYSGLFVNDGTNSPFPLRLVDPIKFLRDQTTTNARPYQMTRSGRDFLLDPPPDANGTSNYTIQGTYMKRVERPMDLDEPVLLDEPMLLVAMPLEQMAADRGLPQAAALYGEVYGTPGHPGLLQAVLTNAQKQRQQFYTPSWNWRSNRR